MRPFDNGADERQIGRNSKKPGPLYSLQMIGLSMPWACIMVRMCPTRHEIV